MLQLIITADTALELYEQLIAIAFDRPKPGTSGYVTTSTDAPLPDGETVAAPELHDTMSLPPAVPVSVPVTTTSTPPLPAPPPLDGLDAAGIRWDARIHTATQTQKQDGTWKRRPRVPDEVYAAVMAELAGHLTPPALEVTHDIVKPELAGHLTPDNPLPPVSAVTAAIDAPATPTAVIDFNVIKDKAAELVDTLGLINGPYCLNLLLQATCGVNEKYGPSIAALELAHYPAFIRIADLLLHRADDITIDVSAAAQVIANATAQ